MADPPDPHDPLLAFVPAAHAWAALTDAGSRLSDRPAAGNACLSAAAEIEKAAAYCLGPRRSHDWKAYALRVRATMQAKRGA